MRVRWPYTAWLSALLTTATVGVSAQTLTDLALDRSSEHLDITITRGTTLFPLWYLAEWVGAQTESDRRAGSIGLRYADRTISMHAGSTTATVNGVDRKLRVSPRFDERGLAYIPLRFVMESLGAYVHWDYRTRAVTVTHPTSREHLKMLPRLAATPLHLEAFSGLTERLELRLDAGADPAVLTDAGETPLHFAARGDQADAAEALLDHGAVADVYDRRGASPLHMAAARGRVAALQVLLERGADPNTPQPGSALSPLHRAATWGSAEVVRLLLDAGADANQRADDGSTPLHCAAPSRHDEVIAVLLDSGADPKAKMDGGRTPLHTVAGHGTGRSPLQSARLLLEHGADVGATDDTGQTPLHVVAPQGGEHARAVIGLLIELGADPNARDHAGRTPLYGVRLSTTAQVLIELGADANASDADGQTPLHVAALRSDPDVLRVLAAAGGDVNATDANGWTPLHAAASVDGASGNRLQVLLEYGAEVDARDKAGETPLALTPRLYRRKAAEVLVRHGADTTVRTAEGLTLLEEAATHLNPDDLERYRGILIGEP